jgi:tetratricopeptide (TPR) repeat protein
MIRAVSQPGSRYGDRGGGLLSFAGTDRFAVDAMLGRGASGDVYRAYDREREAYVAIKLLRRFDAQALYSFKREFRSLADVTHPNLVTLYELFSESGTWFFTMELVSGPDIASYVRDGTNASSAKPLSARSTETPRAAAPTSRTSATEMLEGTTATSPGTDRPAPTHAALSAPEQLARFADVATQLVHGVYALHAAGLLHRDLKPSNVLVHRDGRLVILDFGIAIGRAEAAAGGGRKHVGTPAYMAPEQCAGADLSEACDWYAVGAMLYEAACGRRPFVGAASDVVEAKQCFDAEPIRDIAPQLSPELERLCAALLARSPARRAGGADILRVLDTGASSAATSTITGTATGAGVFVGRERHIAEVMGAFARAEAGEATTLLVGGPSGVGKSAMVARVMDQLRHSGRAAPLAGRCYERESVPYKALDGVIDSLCELLLARPRDEVARWMPRDVGALARLFPVLRRVEAFALGAQAELAADPFEIRRRGVRALRELLVRIGESHTLALWIDDVQWGDAESAALLTSVLASSRAPRCLLIATFRSEEGDASPFIAAMRSAAQLRTLDLTVDALAPSEARALAAALLGDDTGNDERAVVVARESRGHAFFVAELAHYMRETRAPLAHEITLDEVLRARLAELPPAARRLLEVVAVSGRPVPRSVAERVADLSPDDLTALPTLRSRRFARTRHATHPEEIETYHDRIRELLVAGMPAARLRERHGQLGVALEAAGAEAETIAAHFERAGDEARAGRHWAAAANKAAESLAFARAAQLYRQAIALLSDDDAKRMALHAGLGAALANAGRGRQAADAYLQAAARANAADALDFRRVAAEQLLRSGHIEQGLATLELVLDSVGMKLEKTPRRALLRLVWGRARLRARGFGFRERDTSQIAAEALMRCDVCWTVSIGLGLVDSIRSSAFETQHALLALRCGEIGRIARALGGQAFTHAAIGGTRSQRRSVQLKRLAEEFARRVDDPRTLAMAKGAGGMADYQLGEFLTAREGAEEAVAVLRDRCTGVAMELATVQLLGLWSLFYLGELDEFADQQPALLVEARERGDRHAATNLSTGIPAFAWLMRDDVEGAAQARARAMSQWPSSGWFHLQHYWDMFARIQCALYSGTPELALGDIREHWPSLQRSFLLRVRLLRIEALELRARCALSVAAATAGANAERRRLAGAARADARRMKRSRIRAADALAALIEGCASAVIGDAGAAVGRLASAVELLDASHMALHAAAARARLGQLIGGDEGAETIASAHQWMRARGVGKPERIIDLIAPGPAVG